MWSRDGGWVYLLYNKFIAILFVILRTHIYILWLCWVQITTQFYFLMCNFRSLRIELLANCCRLSPTFYELYDQIKTSKKFIRWLFTLALFSFSLQFKRISALYIYSFFPHQIYRIQMLSQFIFFSHSFTHSPEDFNAVKSHIELLFACSCI